MSFSPRTGVMLAEYLRSVQQEDAAAAYDHMSTDALRALKEYYHSSRKSESQDLSGIAILWVEGGRICHHPGYRHLQNSERFEEYEQLHLKHGPDEKSVAQEHATLIAIQINGRDRKGWRSPYMIVALLAVIFGGSFIMTAFVIPATPQAFGTVKVNESWQTSLNILTLGCGWGLLAMFCWQVALTILSSKTDKELAALIPESDAEQAGDEEYPQFEFLPVDCEVQRELGLIDLPPAVKQEVAKFQDCPGRGGREAYLLYHADPGTGRNVAAGMLTVDTVGALTDRWKSLLIQMKGNDESDQKFKLSETLIIDHVANRHFAATGQRKLPDIVSFERRLINPRRLYYLLPHHRSLMRHPDKEIIRLKLRRDFPEALSPNVTTYVRYKMDWADKREMLAATCRFSRVYKMSCIWESVEGFIGQLMEGMLMAVILTYMADLDILASYQWITYIIGILFTSTFVSPILARMIARKVMERRDARMGEKGHEWERKVQNLRVQEDLLKRLKAISWLRAAAAVFYLFLIPGAAFAGSFGAAWLLTITSGTVYLALSIIWFVVNNLVESYTSHVYAEVTYGAIGTNLEARARGFTAFEGITDNFFSVLATFLSTAGFLLGLSIIGMGWLGIVVPLVVVCTIIYSITGYAIPAMSRDYELSLWLGMSHLIPVRGRFSLGGGAWLDVRALNNRYAGVRPFTTKRGESVLPWLETMECRIFFPHQPRVDRRRNELILRAGQDDNAITLKKSRGALKEGRDYRWEGTTLILAPESAKGSGEVDVGLR